MGKIRGLLPFSGVMDRVFLAVSKSIHWSLVSSPMRMPVSLSVCKTAAVTLPHPEINMSISCSVGMKGNLATIL